MKVKSIFLLLLLILLSYFTMFNRSKLFSPFYAIKDLLFLSVHANTPKMDLSSGFKDSIINNLKEDIKELEKLNNITLSISDFEMINATVISRNRDYWFNTLTLNKGKSDGIDIDMAVIDSDGLIGRVSMVTNNTSVVKLITTNDVKSKISAVIHTTNDDIYGIINGYDNDNGLLSLIIMENEIIDKNSLVETTGMGGVFPRGILIGKVYDTIKKEDGITNVVRVKLNSNIKGERYVSVLSRKKVSSN